MKMTLEFEPGDLELVVSTPQSPCAVCSSHDYSCIGCPKQREWNKAYGDKLRERSLEETAQKYWRYLAAVKAQQRAAQEVQRQRQMLLQAGLEELLDLADKTGTASECRTNSFG